MSEFLWSDAWFLLAAKYAANDEGLATKEALIKAGDFINHAIFTPEEIEHGQDALSAANLLHTTGEGYQLGAEFNQFWEQSGAEKHRAIHKQLESLANALGSQ